MKTGAGVGAESFDGGVSAGGIPSSASCAEDVSGARNRIVKNKDDNRLFIIGPPQS